MNLFEDEVEDGTNSKLVNFADQMLPKLQQHREQAVQVWGRIRE